MNAYMMAGDEARPMLYKKFSQYLVVTCWPKMRFRINSWSSWGFILLLANISDDDVKRAFTERPTQVTRRKDFGLADTFVLSDEVGIIELVMQAHPKLEAGPEYLTHLAASLLKVKNGNT